MAVETVFGMIFNRKCWLVKIVKKTR